MKFFLSSRGWGDYSSVKWIGDITRPDSEIIEECQSALKNSGDVDSPNQSDDDILNKIKKARAAWEDKPRQKRESAIRLQKLIDTGYCFNCESWCHGDCGNYSNDPEVRYKREFKRSGQGKFFWDQ